MLSIFKKVVALIAIALIVVMFLLIRDSGISGAMKKIGLLKVDSEANQDSIHAAHEAIPEIDPDLLKFKTGNMLKNSCSEYEKNYCTIISNDDEKLLCKAAVGVTDMGIGTATLFDNKASELLKNNQPFSVKFIWNEEKKKCIVKITQSGILDGSSITRYTTGETSDFVMSEKRKVLVVNVSNSYSE